MVSFSERFSEMARFNGHALVGDPSRIQEKGREVLPSAQTAPAPQSGSDRDCIGPGKYESVENAVNPSPRVAYPARIVLQLAAICDNSRQLAIRTL